MMKADVKGRSAAKKAVVAKASLIASGLVCVSTFSENLLGGTLFFPFLSRVSRSMTPVVGGVE